MNWLWEAFVTEWMLFIIHKWSYLIISHNANILLRIHIYIKSRILPVFESFSIESERITFERNFGKYKNFIKYLLLYKLQV